MFQPPAESHTPHYLPHTKVPTLAFQNARDVARYVAVIIESLIQSNNAAGMKTVLGLPTGSTPMGVYRELIRMHQEDGLDFSRVITFNLDEYWPMQPDSIHSYQRFMWENFFRHINVRKENVRIPDGTLRRRDVEAFCEDYERAIERTGGLDLQLLGIGRSGHIGFNEPGSARNSRTRLVTLDPITRLDAASGFFGEENVPHQAITMGVGSILSARKVIMMAMGEHKAAIIRRAVEEEVSEDVTASFLQTHPNAVFVLDDAASADLTAVRTPWLVGRVDWTPPMEKRALIWLAEQTRKPLLRLDARDFQEHQLYDLVRENGPVGNIRQRVFDNLLSGICPRPGGDQPQTVIVFSPHPDDDVISMGGTLITLAEQGHDLHIAYMTSGNIAVFDHDALRHIEFLSEFLDIFKQQTAETKRLYEKLRADMAGKQPGDPDTPDVLEIKALIRQTEAIAAARIAGVPAEKLHFLNMPFYRTGTVAKRELSDDDVGIVAGLLRELKPVQIYIAGDLSDPHGTHRMCAQSILRALLLAEQADVRPQVWLYRGAWQEYEPHEIERAVPLSPEVTLRKKLAIFRHESQKDRALFPGHDEREFWVRAEERTKNTARIYNELGLPEYFALEGFVQYSGQQL